MDIVKNFKLIKKTITDNVQIIAVSKTKSKDEILKIYNIGHKNFGENKIQELKVKYNQLPKDIKWHMMGHVQRNKVKYIAPFIELIHSVDSLKLMLEINKQGKKNTLYIKVSNPMLKEEISYSKNKIIELINSELKQDIIEKIVLL